MKKKIIYVDMDGVIANFDKAAKEQGNSKRPDLYVNYRDLELMPQAQEALIKLNKEKPALIKLQKEVLSHNKERREETTKGYECWWKIKKGITKKRVCCKGFG